MTRYVDTLAAAQAARVTPNTIRIWASRGHLERQGTDDRGRTLYVLDDVYKRAATRRRTQHADEPPTPVTH